jgi:hypothetical protein
MYVMIVHLATSLLAFYTCLPVWRINVLKRVDVSRGRSQRLQYRKRIRDIRIMSSSSYSNESREVLLKKNLTVLFSEKFRVPNLRE